MVFSRIRGGDFDGTIYLSDGSDLIIPALLTKFICVWSCLHPYKKLSMQLEKTRAYTSLMSLRSTRLGRLIQRSLL